MSKDELINGIQKFADTISKQPLGLARYKPSPTAKHAMCIDNAIQAAKQWGGQERYGWFFIYKISPEFGGYLIATHHAVWHNPKTLELIDVTPLHPDKKHHPIAPGGDVLFLLDDTAKPLVKENLIIPRPSLFFPLSLDRNLVEYIKKLQCEEYEHYKNDYGFTFPAE